MPQRLAWNAYGKAAVRLVKVDRGGPAHVLLTDREFSATVGRAWGSAPVSL